MQGTPKHGPKILERIHAVIANMIRTSGIDMQDTCTPLMVDELLTNIAWAVRSTYHTVLKTTPGAAIFGRDMLFDIPYLAEWNHIGIRRQTLVDQSCAKTNKHQIDFDYSVGQRVLLTKDGILCTRKYVPFFSSFFLCPKRNRIFLPQEITE